MIKKETVNRLLAFRDERDWKQFHSGENLAKSLVIEAAELLELYQWGEHVSNIEHLKEELADVFSYAILLAEHYKFDVDAILNEKITKNEIKYPKDLVKGSAKKYDEY